MSLFSVRWVLQSLGKEDFGLYSVVGGLIVFILFIGNTMAGAVQRFFAYTMGQQDSEGVCKWFNTALGLHFLFVFVLIGVGVPLGNYLLDCVMQIPESRLQTCHWVFYLSILGAATTLISVPAISMFTAKQRIYELSFWGFLHGGMMFGLAISLLHVSGDLLFIYATGMVFIKLIIDSIQNIRAFILFPECRVKFQYWLHLERIKKITSFAGWNLFGAMGAMARNQGLAFLINLFSGAKVNAAYGIANQVASQTSVISTAMYSAMSPEMSRSEGAGDRKRMVSLSLRMSKFAMFSAFLWLVPLFFEIDYVLALWLGDVPEYTASFCRIILLVYAIDKMTIGCTGAVNAHGDIKGFQITVGLLLVLTFPLVWLGYWVGLSPVHAISIMVVTGTMHTLSRVVWLKRLTNTPIMRWVREVLFPSIYVLLPTLVVAISLDYFLKVSLYRLILVLGVTCASIFLCSWFLGFDEIEKNFIKTKVKKLYFLLFKK